MQVDTDTTNEGTCPPHTLDIGSPFGFGFGLEQFTPEVFSPQEKENTSRDGSEEEEVPGSSIGFGLEQFTPEVFSPQEKENTSRDGSEEEEEEVPGSSIHHKVIHITNHVLKPPPHPALRHDLVFLTLPMPHSTPYPKSDSSSTRYMSSSSSLIDQSNASKPGRYSKSPR